MGRVGTQADKAVDAYAAMEALIDSLEIVPTLAALAKRSLQGQLATERIRHEEVFLSYWGARRLGLKRERRADLWEALPSLSEESLRAFYQTYLQGKPRTLLILSDKSRFPLNSFREKGIEVEEVSLETLFGY
jgi:hypothetical protein